MDSKRPRKLNFNAPLLSTKRFGFSGVADTSCFSSVPFSWEQAPGKPKAMERSDSIYGDIDTPRLRPPPCLWHPLEEAAKAEVYTNVLAFDEDDGCDGDNEEDDDKKNDSFTDAIDVLSLSEALDIMQQSDTALSESNNGFRLKVSESDGCESPTYMINRFLPDANALAASSEGFLKGSTKHSYASSPKGCGLEFIFSWLVKNNKLCGIKSPVLPSSTNVLKSRHSSEHKKHRLSIHRPCKNVKEHT
ncbi:hypothetical protein DEO72_LG10g3211 [Vigna unguiculata]|uniref:Uncharacterized protein n=1 Tax=Vigna unguiculata TaxID=3917 RepID=A0A4D6NGD8_VIGUN|nr:hypothetical protein DEO72_LG10g3211 [Vigna unguiculata]